MSRSGAVASTAVLNKTSGAELSTGRRSIIRWSNVLKSLYKSVNSELGSESGTFKSSNFYVNYYVTVEIPVMKLFRLKFFNFSIKQNMM